MKKRYYSPELNTYSIYAPSAYSIINRISGVILSLVWLYLFLTMKIFKFFIFNYTFYLINYYILFVWNFMLENILFSLFYIFIIHYLLGLRHLLWDSGRILDLEDIDYIHVLLFLLSIISLIFIIINY
jgi:succinate dehydrogenase cytochrome b556 subunit